MNRLFLASIIAAAVLASGCAKPFQAGHPAASGVATVKVSGTAQDLSIARSVPFDLDISGDGHTVRIPRGNAVRSLHVSGVNHGIIVLGGTSVQSVEFSGIGTTIHLPKNVHPAASGNGAENRILNDAESVASGELSLLDAGEPDCPCQPRSLFGF